MIGAAADRHQHDVGLDRLGRAALGRLHRQRDAVVAASRRLVTLVAELELQALLGQHALERLGDLAVHAGHDAVEELDHRHLGAQPAPDAAQFQADDAAADHHQVLGHLVQLQRAGRGHDALLVDLDARQRRALAAGGDDDVSWPR